jgi:hypothetical protein
MPARRRRRTGCEVLMLQMVHAQALSRIAKNPGFFASAIKHKSHYRTLRVGGVIGLRHQSRLIRSQRRRLSTRSRERDLSITRVYSGASTSSNFEWLVAAPKTLDVTGSLTAVAVGPGLNLSAVYRDAEYSATSLTPPARPPAILRPTWFAARTFRAGETSGSVVPADPQWARP